ncbi:hypothetical protein K9838_12640 [Xanthomonas phaseoli pv. manihotis]|nr:hypothetical protein [Xanthomonas phaseoli]UEQ13581.1 hypothetical protein K9838_12640 [Xanthomonas phaseoli pv. manihotis]
MTPQISVLPSRPVVWNGSGACHPAASRQQAAQVGALHRACQAAICAAPQFQHRAQINARIQIQ